MCQVGREPSFFYPATRHDPIWPMIMYEFQNGEHIRWELQLSWKLVQTTTKNRLNSHIVDDTMIHKFVKYFLWDIK
jgi:hypothetical protein